MERSPRDPKIFIWVEDRHAVGFIKRLLERLNRQGPTVKSAKGKGNMLAKIRSVALDALKAHGYDKMVVLIDGHGDPEGTKKILLARVPEELRPKIRIVVFEHSIEEWVCAGLSLSLKGRRPLDALLAHERANKGAQVKEADVKRWLPRYASIIDLEKLHENTLFKTFIEALSDCLT